MPLYRCTCPPDTFDDEQRQGIARAITAIHCELTGAPPTFVHVQFFEEPARPGRTPVVLHGGIRAGRDGELVGTLIERCCSAVTALADVPRADISMRTSETNASWVFEGGRVFPEPGGEAAWLAAGR